MNQVRCKTFQQSSEVACREPIVVLNFGNDRLLTHGHMGVIKTVNLHSIKIVSIKTLGIG